MRRLSIIAAIAMLLVTSASSARQSGIRGVDLPADPILPIPLYHPSKLDAVDSHERPGLLSPVEITASDSYLIVRAGIVRFTLSHLVLHRYSRVLELSADQNW